MKLLFRVISCLSLLVPAVVTMVADKMHPAHPTPEIARVATNDTAKQFGNGDIQSAVEIITILENPR